MLSPSAAAASAFVNERNIEQKLNVNMEYMVYVIKTEAQKCVNTDPHAHRKVKLMDLGSSLKILHINIYIVNSNMTVRQFIAIPIGFQT